MKKTYLSPETDLQLIASDELLVVASPNSTNFNSELDNEHTITPDDMLSRGHNDVWADDEEDF